MFKCFSIFVCMTKHIIYILLAIFSNPFYSQNIKSIQLRPLSKNSYTAIVPLGTSLHLSFDDLEADVKDYRYRIEHMNHNWQKSRLLSSQYINGFDENTIINVTNSFNTLQSYTHYEVQFPNTNTVITKSGNYVVSVLDDYDTVVFSRRFVLYENAAIIGLQVSRSRDAKHLNTQQTLEFSINHPRLRINNPSQEIHVTLLKNNNWNETISDIQPTFFGPKQLKYTYTNKTNFWGGNEYLNFDSKFLRNKSINTVRIEKGPTFQHYLYPYNYNPNLTYRYNPDINGQFEFRSLEGNDARTEADYVTMHFSLTKDIPFTNKKVHVYGAFNDFKIEKATELFYDFNSKAYKGSILLKQGFYNYTFATVDENKIVDTNEINGTFFQTENQYTVIAYFRPFGSLYDRVIGVGTSNFSQDK